MTRAEFDPEGTEPTNEPPRLTIISNLFVFNNFLIPTTIQNALIIFDHVTSRRFHCKGVLEQMVWLITDAYENRWPSRCFWRSQYKQMVLTHTIETDVFDPHNRNRWSHNSRATAFCHAWQILLFVPGPALIQLLTVYLPKIIKLDGNLTKFGQKQFCTVFFWDTVYIQSRWRNWLIYLLRQWTNTFRVNLHLS